MPLSRENPPSITDQINLITQRNQSHHHHQHHLLSPEKDPIRSSKSAISSLFLSPFSTDSPSKKKTRGFRGLGCAAGAAKQVSVPAAIRSSAEWEGKKVKKKKKNKNPQQQKRKNKEEDNLRIYGEGSNSSGNGENGGGLNPGSCMDYPDVWCGIGLDPDAVVGSVDCVVNSRRNRGKIDAEQINSRERERERASCLGRRASINPSESLSFLETEPDFLSSRPEPEVFGGRFYRHVRHPSPDGLAEFMILHHSFVMGGRMDRFRDWRLDIDHMSYEQLLELGERIGYVSTGLKENEIDSCVKKLKLSIKNEKCSVCQEDYEVDDDLGKLECGHGFHIECIKQWLRHKNACPVCKKEPTARK